MSVFLVTKSLELFSTPEYQIMLPKDSLSLMRDWKIVQYDCETRGRDPHVGQLLCAQFGNDEVDIRIVVDCTTVDIRLYKEILETKLVIGQNLKFDLQWLYNYGIVPLRVYDTMIVEQLLYLGYNFNPAKPHFFSVSLHSIAMRRLNVDLDKTVRGQIMWRGLDTEVVKYAANDVVWLEKIMWQQMEECRTKGCLLGAKLECDFGPVTAYLEWCGIKLDVEKWRVKMERDKEALEEAEKALDKFIIDRPELFGQPWTDDRGRKHPFMEVDLQGDLWEGFDPNPKCKVMWSSSKHVIAVAKKLGFDTLMQDKKTSEDRDSVMEKHLKKQKGVCDEFLLLYFGRGEQGDDDWYPGRQGAAKQVNSFGQGHLDAINPNTGRIHTQYRQLGCDTGRMSSGSKGESNTDLAKLKHIPKVPYPNMQQLPHDGYTRSCFIAEPGNLWVSCDYSAMESRLGADIYQEKAMIEEFLHGSGDIHSLVAKMIFKELEDVPVKEVKKRFPHLRNAAKPVEFDRLDSLRGNAHAKSQITVKAQADAVAA